MIASREDVYREALCVLATASDHNNNTATFIKSRILPQLANKNSMLDVEGAGIGTMSLLFKRLL